MKVKRENNLGGIAKTGLIKFKGYIRNSEITSIEMATLCAII